MIKDQITINNNYDSLKMKCFNCNETGHFVSECKYLHFIPHKEKIIKRYLYSKPQFRRRKFARKKFKKLNALIDNKLIKKNINDFIQSLSSNYLDNSPNSPNNREEFELEKFEEIIEQKEDEKISENNIKTQENETFSQRINNFMQTNNNNVKINISPPKILEISSEKPRAKSIEDVIIFPHQEEHFFSSTSENKIDIIEEKTKKEGKFFYFFLN